MGFELKPYPAYKDSGIPFWERVPSHWITKPLKHWVHINGKTLSETTSGDYEFHYIDIGSVSTGTLTEKPKKVRFSAAPSRARRIVEQGDTIISTVRTYLKAIYFISEAADNLIVSTGFAVLTPREGLYPKYLAYLLQSDTFTNRVSANSIGIAYPVISEKQMAAFHLAVPPIEEQVAISGLLDNVDLHIRRYIRAKRRQIELLNEQKQAIIQQAVTRGLNPNVRLKPSGVEWLGDVPEHWKTYPLKRIAYVQTGLTLGKLYSSLELVERPYLRVANVQNGYLDLKLIKTIQVPLEEAHACELKVGDVLMTEGGDIDKLGRGYVWNNEIPNCLHQNHIFAVRVDRNYILPYYLVQLITSNFGRTYFQLTAKQTTNLASTNSTTLREFPTFLPDLQEQQLILDYIRSETATIEKARLRIEKELDFIREYHIRMIADTVTGKLDVSKLVLDAAILDGLEVTELMLQETSDDYDGELIQESSYAND